MAERRAARRPQDFWDPDGTCAEATRVDFLVLGIGVNLNLDRNDFPDEFRNRATSLASHGGQPIDRLAFTRRLYGNLEVTLDLCADRGFEGVRAEFDARFQMRGKRIRVLELDGSELRGNALGIDDDGALLLRLETGDVTRVIAGDVTLAKESLYCRCKLSILRREKALV